MYFLCWPIPSYVSGLMISKVNPYSFFFFFFSHRFVCWLKLRHENPEDKLNALVTSENVHFMRTGSPSADNVLLTVKLVNLYKARYRGEGMV